jgi:hypothetical protein
MVGEPCFHLMADWAGANFYTPVVADGACPVPKLMMRFTNICRVADFAVTNEAAFHSDVGFPRAPLVLPE